VTWDLETSLWKTLNISSYSSGFNNPVTDNKMYASADVPQLKKARDHFINKGFLLLEDVGKQIIEQYLKMFKPSDSKLLYSLPEQHKNMTGSLRQNVK